MTLLDRLRDQFPEASRKSLKQWLEHGRVEVDGQVVRDGRTLVSTAVRVTLGRHGAVAFPSSLRLVHEDDDLLVIDKPSGLLTIATDREREQNAYHLLFDYVHAQRPRHRLFIVHRLDRDTSGLIVFAKSERAKRRLQAQFEARDVERIYVAVVEGRVSQEEGTLESRLTEDRDLRVRPGKTGKLAITRYRVRERRRDRTILDLHLGTGRRHQIRVQLAAMGHPIIGDVAHGSRARHHDRLCLHASGLGFTHPQSGARVHFESAPPAGWV